MKIQPDVSGFYKDVYEFPHKPIRKQDRIPNQ
ncbi:hypothetical protein T05_1743 [Trichinella murrelli]|uniref:Uncharacterized protein n=1 Tax=Trichinella murrelli TaxID=144512 RepID=A0A0V0SPV3_9BILA|nr:hypothetical protein T05_1743 [Trichinella murrelli]